MRCLLSGADGNDLAPDWRVNEMAHETVFRVQRDSGLQHDFLTVPEVATILRCSKAHAHNLINGTVKGTPAIPAIAAGRRRLVERASLTEWRRKSRLHLPGDDGGEAAIHIPAETLQAIHELAKHHGLSLEQALDSAIQALKSDLEQGT